MPVPEFVRHLREKVGNELLLMPSAHGVVVDGHGRVLLHQRADNGRWAIPGGIIEPGESPATTVVREVQEETGIACEPVRVSGVYLSPVITYATTGDLAQYVVTLFACRYVSGEPTLDDDESIDVRWFAPDELPELGVHGERVLHALAVLRDGAPAAFDAPAR